MKVLLASYQAVAMIHGGPRTQILGTLKHLPSHGVDAGLFNTWEGIKPGDCDLVHLFATNIGTYHFAREMVGRGIPFVASPIIYSNHSPRFVKTGLSLFRAAQSMFPLRGLWSDYGLASQVCEWASGVLPNSRAEADLVADGLGIPRAKTHVVPNGVEERFEHGDPTLFARKYGVTDFILNVGHIGPARKNVLRLIQALAGIDHPAVIIGKAVAGAEGEACVREAARHPHIRLIDGIDHDSDLLASAYAACRVFALPSQFETPGIAALEAALAGARIVITPHGGPLEYFGDLASYVDPESVESIREGIRTALARPGDTRLREHVKRNYLWSEVARRTAEVYRQALAARRS